MWGLKELIPTEWGCWTFDFGLCDLRVPECIMMPSGTSSGVSHAATSGMEFVQFMIELNTTKLHGRLPEEPHESSGALDPPMCQSRHMPSEKIHSDSRHCKLVVTKAAAPAPKNKLKFKCLDPCVSSLFWEVMQPSVRTNISSRTACFLSVIGYFYLPLDHGIHAGFTVRPPHSKERRLTAKKIHGSLTKCRTHL